MTYIVAFGQPGINAIIADTRVSWRSTTGVLDGQNTALKIGQLFPGCIYGATGSELAARVFIRSFRESMHGLRDNILGFWNRLEQSIKKYPFPRESFQIVFSHRGLGVPRFFLLDSASGTLQEFSGLPDYHLWAVGSGCTILNEVLEREWVPRLQEAQQLMLADAKVSKAQIHGMSPYLLSLWLNERSLTYEAAQWERHGVGGVFHFILQTADADWAQRPAVYVFSEIDRASNTIRPWMYRVAAVRGGLYIESHDHYTERCIRDVIFNDATFNIAAHGDVELLERVEKELAALPFYNFFGIGFVHPWDRKLYSFHFSDDGKREDVLDSSGKLIPSIKALLDANFSKV